MKHINKESLKQYMQQRKQRKLEKKQMIEAKKQARRESELGKKLQKVYAVMNRISLLLHLLLAGVLNFIIEAMSRHSVVKAWEYMRISTWAFLFNTYMIFATFLLVYLVRRRIFARIIISVLWIVLGVVNGYMLSVRVTPFNAQDMKVIGDAITMIDKYFTGIQGVLIVCGILVVVAWLVFMWRHAGKYEGKQRLILSACGAVLGIGAIIPLTDYAIEKRILSDYFGNIAFAYEDYGLPYCFSASLFNTGMTQPEEYSEELIAKINQNNTLRKEESERAELPNIIIIQLESFFDPSEVEFFTTSKDPIPTFRKLMQQYSSGYFKVPSIGAGTANTEFEVLTGMNLRYFGPGEYPYKTILKERETESVATALKALGYGAHALHNNGGNFYSRADVFNNMGFDSYTSKEFMYIPNYTENGWAKDEVLTEHILNALDSTTQQDLVFGITVQGHGDYPEEQVIENPKISVYGMDDPGKKNAWEYYVNHLYETDQFIADLISELEKRGEPTVLVLYGDHLPTMGLEAKDLKNRYLYNTNYAMWDNIGLEKIDRHIPSYQISAEILERVGIHSGTIFNYHQERRGTQDYMSDLENLQYDMLYGEEFVYGGKENSPLKEGHLVMGVLDVTLSDIQKHADGYFILTGENLTEESFIFVNGDEEEQRFVNATTIELHGCDLKEGDEIVIRQVGSSNRIFRSSAEYVYSKGKLVKR